jgi:eukaryotic-like serine/threonine-protein kinase
VKIGSILAGKFRIERVIGRGSMGVVVEATDVTLSRRVAVKLILPHYAGDEQLRGRFIREAQVMTRLQTEHIARVLEVGQLEDETLYLAMEYLEGQSLEDLISSGGPLPVADAVDLILEALDAITETHDLGLIHRDFKPANLFLAARKGKPPILKVLDFGIAKDTAAGAKLTATGTLPGTPAYMAPEQIALREDLIDARADVWAVGVTLYELLAGELPWNGPINVMLSRIRSEASPRLRARRPDVAPELEAIIERCLMKHPADRFASAGELAAVLSELRVRGLVRSERGDERRVAETEINVHRRRVRETAETEDAPTPARPAMPVDAPRRRPVLPVLPVVATFVAVGTVVGVVVTFQGRLSATSPARAASAPAPMSATPSAAESVPTAFLSGQPAPQASIAPVAPVISARRSARHLRVVSAKNTGDRAWRGWIDRHRQRIDGCTAQQTCPIGMSLRLSKVDAKTSVALQATSPDTACTVHPVVVDCMNELMKDPVPPPDVCTDPAECHADVLLAFD